MLYEIARNFSEVNISVKEVSRNVSESAKGLTEVTSNISGVNAAVTDTAKGVVQVISRAVELAKFSENLKSFISQFKVK